MLGCLRHLVFFLLLIPVAVAKAEDVTSLVNAVTSFHLTPEEKALFTEATDRFKKYEIPKSIKISSVFWLDNDHLVFTALKYPGWEIKPDEMPRIITYNVTTGEIADSGYRGRLFCINHLGDVLINQETRIESLTGSRVQKWITGRWGQALSHIQRLENSFLSLYRCEFISFGTFTKRMTEAGYEFDREMIMPLLDSHGVVQEVEYTRGKKTEAVSRLIQPSGEKILLSNRPLSHIYLTFLPWCGCYFEAGAAPPEPISFYPDGEIQVHRIPTLFSIWGLVIRSSTAAYPSGRGILWMTQQGKYFWRKQGIFLQPNSDLLRIELGQAMSDLKSSPDGCRIFTQVFRGDPFKNPGNKNINLVIDICEENHK